MGTFQEFLFQDSSLMWVKDLRESRLVKLHTQRAPDGVFSRISGLSLREAAGRQWRIKDRLNSAGPTRWEGHNYSDRMYNKCLFYESL